uniref:Uncharacterized protein n=1 Tax=Plectus sambesii TaxID=2011161 RepID=A0A914WFD6_9BILA
MGRGSGRRRFTGGAREALTPPGAQARYSQIRRHRSAGQSAGRVGPPIRSPVVYHSLVSPRYLFLFVALHPASLCLSFFSPACCLSDVIPAVLNICRGSHES